jgi:glycosyltransferase involved in cell wall biosynthesis
MEIAGAQNSRLPLVSVILTTRDRPRFFSLALDYYRAQTYPNRELVVVDDGEIYPVDASEVEAMGGRLVRTPTGTLLGKKLNRGIEQAQGVLIQKMDDDDFYAPRFLETMVSAVVADPQQCCRPTLAFMQPFLFFELSRWEVRRSAEGNIPGATFMFAREDWEERPFRGLPADEDTWFFVDQITRGVNPLAVRKLDIFMAVRHRDVAIDKGHTWTRQMDGRALEDDLRNLEPYERGADLLLPFWAAQRYREMMAAQAVSQPLPFGVAALTR